MFAFSYTIAFEIYPNNNVFQFMKFKCNGFWESDFIDTLAANRGKVIELKIGLETHFSSKDV